MNIIKVFKKVNICWDNSDYMEIYIWSSSKCVGFGSIVYHFYLLLRNWDCKKVPSITHAHHHLQCWFGPTPHCRKSYKQRGRLWIWCPEEWVWKFGGKGHYWPHKGKMVLDIDSKIAKATKVLSYAVTGQFATDCNLAKATKMSSVR